MTRVLVVCTGNICRSPAAELLLRAGVGPEIDVSSAGTDTVDGWPVDPVTAELLRRRGLDPDPLRSSRVTGSELTEADLVLVMSPEHRSAVVQLAPSAVRRTFLLREAAAISRYVAGTGWPSDVVTAGDRLSALPRLAPAARAALGAGTREMGVDDPHRGPAEVHAAAVAVIESAVVDLLQALRSDRQSV